MIESTDVYKSFESHSNNNHMCRICLEDDDECNDDNLKFDFE